MSSKVFYEGGEFYHEDCLSPAEQKMMREVDPHDITDEECGECGEAIDVSDDDDVVETPDPDKEA